MEIAQSEHHLCRVEQDLGLGEPTLFLQVVKQTATTLVVKKHIQLAAALERVVKFKNERMAKFTKELLFQLDIAKEISCLQVPFVKHFHSIES